MDSWTPEARRGDSGEGPVPRKGRGRRAHRQRVHCRQAEDEDKEGRHPSSRPALAAAASAATAFAADFQDSCSGVRSMYCHVSPSHRHTLCHTAGAGNLSPLSLPSPMPSPLSSPLPLASPIHLLAEFILGVRTTGCLDQERLPPKPMTLIIMERAGPRRGEGRPESEQEERADVRDQSSESGKREARRRHRARAGRSQEGAGGEAQKSSRGSGQGSRGRHQGGGRAPQAGGTNRWAERAWGRWEQLDAGGAGAFQEEI